MDGNPLRAVFVVALIVFGLGLASRCSADARCTLDPTERTENADGSYTLQAPYFECLLIEYKAAGNLGEQVADLEKQKALLLGDLERAQAHLKLEERATGRAVEALDAYQKIHGGGASLLESPVLWFAIGALATTGVVLAAGSLSK